jgi:hypothetical protein
MARGVYDITMPDGKVEPFPSVTTILKALPAPKEITRWIDRTPDAGRYMRDRATIGTIIHWRIQRFLAKKHNLPMQPLRLDCTIITPQMRDAIDVIWSYFLDAEEELELIPYYLEKMVVNYKEKYAGTLDIAGLVNGKRSIVDIKTYRDLYGDHTAGAQLAAYKRACDYRAEDLYILRLHEETGWNLIPVSDDWGKFQEALKLHRTKNQRRKSDESDSVRKPQLEERGGD